MSRSRGRKFNNGGTVALRLHDFVPANATERARAGANSVGVHAAHLAIWRAEKGDTKLNPSAQIIVEHYAAGRLAHESSEGKA